MLRPISAANLPHGCAVPQWDRHSCLSSYDHGPLNSELRPASDSEESPPFRVISQFPISALERQSSKWIISECPVGKTRVTV
jgi:hypothetical protein